MKTIFAAVIFAVFFLPLQQFFPSASSFDIGHQRAFAIVELGKDETTSNDKGYQDTIKELGDSRDRLTKYIIIIIFAVLFIAGIYWWTYGKLHHKLPRY
jgi:hypothetical protein